MGACRKDKGITKSKASIEMTLGPPQVALPERLSAEHLAPDL
jgi:hypothetical protein